MAWIITNMTPAVLIIDGVEIPPNMPLRILDNGVSEAMMTARDAGALRIMDETETLEERRADIKAMGDLKL